MEWKIFLVQNFFFDTRYSSISCTIAKRSIDAPTDGFTDADIRGRRKSGESPVSEMTGQVHSFSTLRIHVDPRLSIEITQTIF